MTLFKMIAGREADRLRERRPCHYETFVMITDGSNLTRLTDDPANDATPKFQP